MYQEHLTDIKKVIENYFDGIFYGDADQLASCFHDDVFIYGDIDNTPYLKNIEQYIQGVRDRKSPNDLNESFRMKIIGIDIMGNIAMAKLHVPMLGKNYYDYVSMTKLDGHWKIVNKIFKHVA